MLREEVHLDDAGPGSLGLASHLGGVLPGRASGEESRLVAKIWLPVVEYLLIAPASSTTDLAPKDRACQFRAYTSITAMPVVSFTPRRIAV